MAGLLHLASGMRAQALVHSGDKVPVCLAVKPDYTMSVQAMKSYDVKCHQISQVSDSFTNLCKDSSLRAGF